MSEKEIAYVYFQEKLAGTLTKGYGVFEFEYDKDYQSNQNNFPLSLSLPLDQKKHAYEKLHPFFEGLLSEGWMRRIQEQSQKIDTQDSFYRLVKNGRELIGAVKIFQEKQ